MGQKNHRAVRIHIKYGVFIIIIIISWLISYDGTVDEHVMFFPQKIVQNICTTQLLEMDITIIKI